MHNNLSTLRTLTVASLLLCSACSIQVQYPEEVQSSSSTAAVPTVVSESAVSSETALPETANVTYTGTVKPAGISVYMEGTHRLEIDATNFVLLETDSGIDLDGYVNERVEVTGAVRPTVEAGATIMRVEQITLRENPTSSLPAKPVVSSSSAAVSSVATAAAPKPTAAVVSSVAKPVILPSSSTAAVSSVAQPTKEPVAEVPKASHTPSEQVASMSKDNYDGTRWTQTPYCNTSAGMCVPIHKNWWYKSFQGTVGHLWYVEFSNAEIENVGDGPISLRLVSGTLESKGATEGELRLNGNIVTGFRSWTNGSHIEVVADSSLRSAVEYLLNHITSIASSAAAQ